MTKAFRLAGIHAPGATGRRAFALALAACLVPMAMQAQGGAQPQPLQPPAQGGQAPASPTIPEGLRDKAVTIGIKALVLGPASTVAWQANSVRDTIPGTPVGVKLVGGNVAILVQITPYDNGKGGLVLVTQSQVWVKRNSGEFSYFTSLDSVAVQYDETVYLFPLGRLPTGASPMRIEIEVRHFTTASPVGGQQSPHP